MTTTIIIAICVLLLLAYFFDLTSSKSKIPSVILLLFLGYIVNQITQYFLIKIPDLNAVLPLLGMVGLILIVLEGSLELELNKSKMPIIAKTTLMAILPLLYFSVVLALLFEHFGNLSFKCGLANAIPIAVVSSSIAIPTAQNLDGNSREFVTYESSLSDIFGVIFFNFITLNEEFTSNIFSTFSFEILLVLLVSFFATISLAYLLSRIKHHIKYIPIILMVVLIYAVSKHYHLPALVFILFFGIFLGNLNELKENRFIQRLKPDILDTEVYKFKELTTEITFLIRSIFFLVFGFLINTQELLNTETIFWAVGICAAIFLIRYLFLKGFNLSVTPLVYIAPRGLITILLFLSIPASQTSELVNKSLIIQIIILTALVMMFGMMFNKKKLSV
ncbi:MAG: cation:proton antiporter [Saprospiraceae bacterium]